MVSSVGLAAAYPGFQSARQADQKIESQDIEIANAKADQEADQYLGNAAKWFQSQVPGAQPMVGGPQPPMPGQPSTPRPSVATPPQMQSPGFQPGPVSAPPQMQSQGFQPPGGGGGMPPAGAQPQGQPSVSDALAKSPMAGRMDLKTIMTAITQANPGGRPEVIARTLTKALPLMNAQAQMDYRAMLLADRQQRTGIMGDEADRKLDQGDRRLEQGGQRIQQGQDRLDTSRTQGEQRLQQGERRLEQQGGEFGSRDERRKAQTAQGQTRIDQAGAKETRLAAQGQIRQDQRWAQLEQQKAGLEERIRSGDRRANVSEWRAIVDAQHKRAMEIIQSASINSNLRPEERKALLDEQNKFYNDTIKNMKPGAQPPAAPGGAKVQDRMVPGGAGAAPAPQQPQSRPRAKNPKTGEEVEFDGTNWVPIAAAAAAPPP